MKGEAMKGEAMNTALVQVLGAVAYGELKAYEGARAVIVSSQKLAKALIPAVLFSSDCHDVIGIEDIRTGQPVTLLQIEGELPCELIETATGVILSENVYDGYQYEFRR